MLMLLSPAKSLDFESPLPEHKMQKPLFLKQSQVLIDLLRIKSPQEISELMSLSDKLAALNVARYELWDSNLPAQYSRAALWAFNGDVYEGLQALSFSESDIEFAQQHLRILSGLYGVLRPLDKIMPYRLEMGTSLENANGKNLYAYWGDYLADFLLKELAKQGDNLLINLASEEYSKAALRPVLLEKVQLITPQFREESAGKFKMVSFYAKRARGLMAFYIIKNKLNNLAALKKFSIEGYAYNAALSDEKTWTFTRKMPAKK